MKLADLTDERFSPTQHIRVAKFEAAEEPEEIRVERVAHVLWGALYGLPWSQCEFRGEANTFRLMACAAISELEAPR